MVFKWLKWMFTQKQTFCHNLLTHTCCSIQSRSVFHGIQTAEWPEWCKDSHFWLNYTFYFSQIRYKISLWTHSRKHLHLVVYTCIGLVVNTGTKRESCRPHEFYSIPKVTHSLKKNRFDHEGRKVTFQKKKKGGKTL